jgi:hypothetical protein
LSGEAGVMKLGLQICYEHGLSTANSVLKPWTYKDPQVTWPHDQEDVPRPGVMAQWHHSFPSFIEAPCASPPSLIKSSRRIPQDPAGIPPHFYQGIPLRVMILEI